MSKGPIAIAFVTLAVMVAYIEYRLPKTQPAAPSQQEFDSSEIDAKIDRLTANFEGIELWKAEIEEWRRTVETARPAHAPAIAEKSAEKKPLNSKEAVARAKQILAAVKAGNVDGDEVNELWNVLLGSGLEVEAIRAFEAYAKANPKDPEGWYGLGVSNIAALLATRNQLEIIKYSGNGDKAFDAALKLNDQHFGARYSKAFSYTQWPPFLGKGPEAIKQFEILVDRHGTDSTNPLMEQVYQSLGTEYLKAGNAEKAKASFENGLRTFPESKVLREQLEAMGD